jgi:hypothetical protein
LALATVLSIKTVANAKTATTKWRCPVKGCVTGYYMKQMAQETVRPLVFALRIIKEVAVIYEA